MNRSELADLNAFVVVANHLSFRAASAQLGVTASALSHSMRQLEERLGARLLHRTTRSVSLTDAGLRLLEQLRPAIEQISGALENLNQQRQRPFGRLRIYAGHPAAAAVIAPDAEDHRSFGLMTPGAARRSLPLRRHAIHGRMQQTNGI
jgi:DNA-binding transcriptional LysR family regulator